MQKGKKQPELTGGALSFSRFVLRPPHQHHTPISQMWTPRIRQGDSAEAATRVSPRGGRPTHRGLPGGGAAGPGVGGGGGGHAGRFLQPVGRGRASSSQTRAASLLPRSSAREAARMTGAVASRPPVAGNSHLPPVSSPSGPGTARPARGPRPPCPCQQPLCPRGRLPALPRGRGRTGVCREWGAGQAAGGGGGAELLEGVGWVRAEVRTGGPRGCQASGPRPGAGLEGRPGAGSPQEPVQDLGGSGKVGGLGVRRRGLPPGQPGSVDLGGKRCHLPVTKLPLIRGSLPHAWGATRPRSLPVTQGWRGPCAWGELIDKQADRSRANVAAEYLVTTSAPRVPHEIMCPAVCGGAASRRLARGLGACRVRDARERGPPMTCRQGEGAPWGQRGSRGGAECRGQGPHPGHARSWPPWMAPGVQQPEPFLAWFQAGCVWARQAQ